MHSSRQLAAWLVLGREQQRKLGVPAPLSSSPMNETAALLLLLLGPGLKAPPPRVPCISRPAKQLAVPTGFHASCRWSFPAGQALLTWPIP